MILFGCHTSCLLKGKQIPRKKNKIYKDHLLSKNSRIRAFSFLLVHTPAQTPSQNPIST